MIEAIDKCYDQESSGHKMVIEDSIKKISNSQMR